MKMQVLFKEKSVYGNIYFYPMNEVARALCLIARRKTLSIKEISVLKETNKFNIEIVVDHSFKQL